MTRLALSFALFLFGGIACAATPSLADTLVILDREGDEVATFEYEALAAMDMETIKTGTPWTDGVDLYEGVSLEKLLSLAEAEGEAYTAIALNDYAVSIPSRIIAEYEPIVALRMNGTRLTLDNKGPYWIMFDFDSPEVQAVPEMRGLSIWALSEIEIE